MSSRAAALVLALVSATAHADGEGHGVTRADVIGRELAAARQREADVDYAGALRIIDQTIARGGAEPTQYVELHLIAGRLAAGLDRPAEAEAHFARVLALRPDTALPAGTSPKITEPFEAARARSVPLVISVGDNRGLVRITPSTDPLGLVAGIRVHVVDTAGNHQDVVDRRALRIVIPQGTSVIEVSALDPDGHSIWITTPAPVATTDGPRDNSRAPTATSPAWYARWQTWAIVAGAGVAVGGLSAWRFSVAQDDFDTGRNDPDTSFAELRDIEDRGRAWGLTANVAFGVAAASAIASAIVFVVVDDAPEVYADPSNRTVGIATRF